MDRISIRVLPALLLILALAPSVWAGDLENRLLDAAKKGDVATARTLLRQGANVNAPDNDQLTPLHWAALMGELQMVALLVEKGADVNQGSSNKVTPLYAAATCSSFRARAALPEIVRMLIRKGANVDGIDQVQTPLAGSLTLANWEVSKILIENGANLHSSGCANCSPPIFFAVSPYNGSGEMLKFLIQKGADPNAKNSRRETPLTVAIHDGLIEDMKALLENGADINAIVRGYTPLMHAVGTGNRPGNVEATRLLLEEGADLDIRDQDNSAGYDVTHRTALEWASRGCGETMETCKNSQIVNLLVQAKLGISMPEATPPR